ncbi:MAG: flavin reductase family protein [Methanomassiliicoccales archaeon]|nr:flavin reductase family protein [Methanomassiliicoccales archaeon]
MNSKKDLGGLGALYPMPVVIVGAMDGERANYAAVAHVGILNYGQPQHLSIGLHKSHRTNHCIKATGAFSICMPSEDLVVRTDYAGIASGKREDKSKLFSTFFSPQGKAPMAQECPVCMDCGLHDVLDYGTHEIFVGEVLHTYADDSVLTDGHIDIGKLRPMLFDMGSKQYWSLGRPIAKCWEVGRGFKGE